MATYTEQPDPSVQTVTNGATITLPAGGSIAKIITMAGNVTGLVLTAGTIDGQECWIGNNAAFTATFDVVGTSNVANGTSAVIAAHGGMILKWYAGLTTPAWVVMGKG